LKPWLRWLVPAAMALGLAFPAHVAAATPTADDKTPSTLEDAGVGIPLSGGDPDGLTLTFAIGTGPTNGTLGTIATPNCNGQTPSVCIALVTYSPDADANGSDSFTYTTNNGTLDSLPATVTITITAVNDAPSFTKGSNPTVLEDSGPASFSGWATNISAGPSDESGQTVTFTASAGTSALFSSQPAVAANGDLTFTPALNKHGTTTVTVVAHDTGGTLNGGVSTSSQSFPLTITSVNDPPTAHNDSATIQENAPATAIAVLANDSSFPDGTEVLTIVSAGPAGHGTVAITGGGTGLTYRPNAMFAGADVFNYTIEDPGGLPSTAAVLITVVNDTKAPNIAAPVQTIRTGVYVQSTYIYGRLTWAGSDSGVGIQRFELQRSVNGGAYAAVTLPTLKSTSMNINFPFTVLRFRVRAIDLNGNTSYWAYGPSFGVNRYQENNSLLVYGGAWSTFYNASNSGGYTKYAYFAGRSVSITRAGRDFAFVAPRSSTRGSVRIYVDGVLSATVSLQSSSLLYRQVVWTRHFSGYATHTIRAVVVGNGRVDVDCFLVLR
jgi:hypothetical protein